MIAPVKSTRITNSHGTPGWGKFGKHTGIDYGIPTGTPVYAPGAGTIRAAWFGSSGGNMLEIAIGSYWHRFLHLDRYVKRTGSVKEGELIAYSGATGQVTGPHLHWDVRKAGTTWDAAYANYVDPLKLITAAPPAQEGDIVNKEGAIAFWRAVRFKHSPTATEQNQLIGKDFTKVLTAEYQSAAFLKRKIAVQNYDAVVEENARLKAGIGNPDDAVDAGKWRQLINMLPFVKK